MPLFPNNSIHLPRNYRLDNLACPDRTTRASSRGIGNFGDWLYGLCFVLRQEMKLFQAVILQIERNQKEGRADLRFLNTACLLSYGLLKKRHL